MSDHGTPGTDPDAPPADPEELDFTDDETVVELEERRYVVGTNGRPNVRPGHPSTASGSEPASGSDSRSGSAAPPDDSGFESPATPTPAADRDPIDGDRRGGVDRRAVSRWLATSFESDGFDYGVDVTVHADGDTVRNRSASNDVVSTFDTLVSSFVSNAGTEAPPPEALGLLLAAADTPVDVPPAAIKRFARDQGLSATDSIGDLVRAAEDAGGFRIE